MLTSMPQETSEYSAGLSISGCCQPANCSLIRVTSRFRQGGVVDSERLKKGEKKVSSETGQLDLELFKRIAFTKKQCTKCDSYFWTSDSERKTCGDPPCDSYTFIGKSPISCPYTLKEMRGLFIGFFTGDHGFLKPYPVVPRWRDDVLLVNASIYNFQPHVTSGRVKPPDNPESFNIQAFG